MWCLCGRVKGTEFLKRWQVGRLLTLSGKIQIITVESFIAKANGGNLQEGRLEANRKKMAI